MRRYFHSFSQDGEDYWAEPLPRDPRGQGWGGDTARSPIHRRRARAAAFFTTAYLLLSRAGSADAEQMGTIPSVLVFSVILACVAKKQSHFGAATTVLPDLTCAKALEPRCRQLR